MWLINWIFIVTYNIYFYYDTSSQPCFCILMGVFYNFQFGVQHMCAISDTFHFYIKIIGLALHWANQRKMYISFVVREKIMNIKNSSIDCISKAQVRWNTKRLFNWNTGILLAEAELKKKKTPAWEDWINSFILREYSE